MIGQSCVLTPHTLSFLPHLVSGGALQSSDRNRRTGTYSALAVTKKADRCEKEKESVPRRDVTTRCFIERRRLTSIRRQKNKPKSPR
eukprot:scaffold9345_cov120-Cylindrotheca_fusiformis.AAC.8